MPAGTPLQLQSRTFGRLEVIEKTLCPKRYASDSYRSSSWWKCRCVCGSEVVRVGKNLMSGLTTSCGCAQKEQGVKAAKVWQEKRAITPSLRSEILRMMCDQQGNEKIAKQFGIASRRVAQIRKDMNLPAHNKWGAPRRIEATL